MNTTFDRPGTRQDVRQALDGEHPALLFVGSGCHRYLKKRLGVEYPRVAEGNAIFDWGSLLRQVSGGESPPHHADNTAIWESIVAQRCAKHPFKSPQDHEDELLKVVRETIRQGTPAASDPALGGFGDRLRRSGVNTVVTLNFDRTLDRALQRASRAYPVRRPGDHDVGDYRTQLRVDADGITVWYAHGMAEERVRYRSIQLGLVGYADTVSALQARYAMYRTKRAAWLGKANGPAAGSGGDQSYWPIGAFTSWASDRSQNAENWLEVFLTSHVIFIGCGLSHAEIDVWFALHARQRELLGVPPAERPQTFFLHPLEFFPSHLTTRPAGLRPVVADSFDDAWSIVLRD